MVILARQVLSVAFTADRCGARDLKIRPTLGTAARHETAGGGIDQSMSVSRDHQELPMSPSVERVVERLREAQEDLAGEVEQQTGAVSRLRTLPSGCRRGYSASDADGCLWFPCRTRSARGAADTAIVAVAEHEMVTNVRWK
jgi:hypothetical protein